MDRRAAASNYFIFSIFILAVVSTQTGCDLIKPPKKDDKKVVTATPATAAAVAEPVLANDAPLGSNVVARVGSWTLTPQEFDERLKLLKTAMKETGQDFDVTSPENKASVLNELIRQQLLVQAAEATGIAEQKEIADAISDFRRSLLVQELANRLTKDVIATDKDAQDYYDKNKALFVEPVQWKVREIVVDDEAAAKNILVQVLQGGDFAEIAKAQSKAKSASTGGDVAVFTKAPFDAMQTAIASLDAGGTSPVFKGPNGFYIVKVESKKGGAPKTFADVRKDLVSGLTVRKQQEAILDHIDQLAKKTKVQINKDLIGIK